MSIILKISMTLITLISLLTVMCVIPVSDQCGTLTHVQETNPVYESNVTQVNHTYQYQEITQLDELIEFLASDTTNERTANRDTSQGEYFACTGFSRELSNNASKSNISIGCVGLRDTQVIGKITKLHAINYAICDDVFVLIEPQTDQIYTIDEFTNTTCFQYAALHKDSSEIMNYRISRKMLDLDMNNYNMTELVELWNLTDTYK